MTSSDFYELPSVIAAGFTPAAGFAPGEDNHSFELWGPYKSRKEAARHDGITYSIKVVFPDCYLMLWREAKTLTVGGYISDSLDQNQWHMRFIRQPTETQYKHNITMFARPVGDIMSLSQLPSFDLIRRKVEEVVGDGYQIALEGLTPDQVNATVSFIEKVLEARVSP